jgi:hypothetical protein
MTRMYDRILREAKKGGMLGQTGLDGGALADPLSFSEVLLIDNVTTYYYEQTDQEYWQVTKDYPNLAPPFDNYWMEYRPPSKIVSREYGMNPVADELRQNGTFGTFFDAVDLAKGRPKGLPFDIDPKDDIRWLVSAIPFLEYPKGRFTTQGITVYRIRSDGTVYEADDPKQTLLFMVPRNGSFADKAQRAGNSDAVNDALCMPLHPCWLATSFLHCKNIRLVRQEPPAKPSKRAARKYGEPLTKYYTLEIEPMKKVLETEGGANKTGLKNALHICRGHFRTYTPENPCSARSPVLSGYRSI